MVLAEHSSVVSVQAVSGPLSSEEFSGPLVPAERSSGTADRRTRARIRDLDRATCRTRLSQRRFLIQQQAESGGDVRGELQRYRENMVNCQWSGRVVDWD